MPLADAVPGGFGVVAMPVSSPGGGFRERTVGMMAEPLHWFKRGGGKFPQFLLCVTGAKTSGVLTCVCVPTLNKHVNTALGVPGQ